MAGFIAHSVTSQLGLTKPFTAGLFWRRNNFGGWIYCTQCHFIVHSVTSQLGLTKAFTAGRTCLAAQHLRETCGWIYRTQCHFTVGLDQTIHSWTFLAAQQFRWLDLLYTVSLYCTQCHFTVGLDQSIHSWTDLGFLVHFTVGLV